MLNPRESVRVNDMGRIGIQAGDVVSRALPLGPTATLAEPLAARQTASLLEEPVPDLAGLIDTLADRVGSSAFEQRRWTLGRTC